jgi:hypothetical protein
MPSAGPIEQYEVYVPIPSAKLRQIMAIGQTWIHSSHPPAPPLNLGPTCGPNIPKITSSYKWPLQRIYLQQLPSVHPSTQKSSKGQPFSPFAERPGSM